jgi:hypothetical protein
MRLFFHEFSIIFNTILPALSKTLYVGIVKYSASTSERITKSLFQFQEELPNKFYGINQQDTETLEHLDDAGKMTSETGQALKFYLEANDAADGIYSR